MKKALIKKVKGKRKSNDARCVRKNEQADLKKVLDYMWKDEETHYQASPSKNHIFVVLKRVAKKVGYKSGKRARSGE